MIKRGVAGLVALLLLANQAALAQQQTGGAQRNRYCFNKKETEAESEVRTGIILRETLRRCARFDAANGQESLDAWYQFDRDNAEKFIGAVTMRGTAIKRIYPKRTAQEQWENDASIATRAAPEVDAAICKSAYDMMDKIQAEGWPGFKYYAKLQQSLLINEIPVCR